jgi:hypothetical protein
VRNSIRLKISSIPGRFEEAPTRVQLMAAAALANDMIRAKVPLFIKPEWIQIEIKH